MTTIHVDETIRIKGTSTCYQLERKHNGKNGVEWRPYKYYTSFARACEAACEQEFRVHPAYGLSEALDAARGLSQKYGELLDSAIAEIGKRASEVDAKLRDAA